MSYKKSMYLFYTCVALYIGLIIVLLSVFELNHLQMSPFYGFWVALFSLKPKKKEGKKGEKSGINFKKDMVKGDK